MPEDLEQELEDSEVITELRKDAKDGKAARKELAFLKAGVNTETKLGQLLMSSWSGELDVDAIKTEWADLNPMPPAPLPEGSAPPPDAAGMPPTHLSANAARSTLAGSPGSSPAGTTADQGPHPVDAGIKGFRDRVNEGEAEDTASAEYFGRVLTAAAAGDQRVIWNEQAHNEMARQLGYGGTIRDR